MTDPQERALAEVWEWKRRAEEATQGMSPNEVMAFYRVAAEEAERRLGVRLRSRPAAEGGRSRPLV